MLDADLPPPEPGTDAEAGVRYYVEHIVSGPNRQDVTNLLKGWLTDQIVADVDPGDFGALYCVWADLEDVADAFQDDATFDDVAPVAASEWLSMSAEPASRAAWIARWNAWLMTYGETHTVFWQRPGFRPNG